MIKIRHAVNAVVAIQASQPKLLQVGLHEERVVLVVTLQASVRLELIEASQVTGGAAHGLAGIILAVAGQAEASVGEVLKSLPLPGYGLPVLGGVAFGTILAEQAQVQIGFSVATGTIGGKGKKILRCLKCSLAGVAGSTSQICMETIQRKIGAGMDEIGHAVAAIVASQALQRQTPASAGA